MFAVVVVVVGQEWSFDPIIVEGPIFRGDHLVAVRTTSISMNKTIRMLTLTCHTEKRVIVRKSIVSLTIDSASNESFSPGNIAIRRLVFDRSLSVRSFCSRKVSVEATSDDEQAKQNGSTNEKERKGKADCDSDRVVLLRHENEIE